MFHGVKLKKRIWMSNKTICKRPLVGLSRKFSLLPFPVLFFSQNSLQNSKICIFLFLFQTQLILSVNGKWAISFGPGNVLAILIISVLWWFVTGNFLFFFFLCLQVGYELYPTSCSTRIFEMIILLLITDFLLMCS